MKTWSIEDNDTPRSATFALGLAMPVLHREAPPLVHLCNGFPALQQLRLNHVAAEALTAVGSITQIGHLTIGIAWPRPSGTHPADEAPVSGWLDWAAGLRKLFVLDIEAVVIHLQPEQGLSSLQPLKRLRHLRLHGCALLSDAGVDSVAALPKLVQLEVTPSSMSERGVARLATALPHLHSLGLTALSPAAAAAVLQSAALRRVDLTLSLPGGSVLPFCVLEGARPLHLSIANSGPPICLSAPQLRNILWPKTLTIRCACVTSNGWTITLQQPCTVPLPAAPALAICASPVATHLLALQLSGQSPCRRLQPDARQTGRRSGRSAGSLHPAAASVRRVQRLGAGRGGAAVDRARRAAHAAP